MEDLVGCVRFPGLGVISPSDGVLDPCLNLGFNPTDRTASERHRFWERALIDIFVNCRTGKTGIADDILQSEDSHVDSPKQLRSEYCQTL